MSPPITAPGTLPMPPRMAAANKGSKRSKPMKGRICTVMPSTIPAAEASAPAMSQVALMTCSTSIPETRASDGFSATARIARPIGVLFTRRCTAMTSVSVTAIRKSWSGVARMPRPTGIAIWMSRLK